MRKKIVFMGTPSFAVPILESLIKDYEVCLVVCQPDKMKDRKGKIVIPPVKRVALEHGIDVFQPDNIRKEYEEVLKYEPDLIITCAYGQIIPDILLDYPIYGSINVHGSLLPDLRGGAPIHWAIIRGYKETGVTIMYMDNKMDQGDIICSRKISILDSDNLDILYEKMAYLGRDLLLEVLPKIFNHTNKRIRQNSDLVTYGMNIKKEDTKINFNKDSLTINNLVRGLSSNPGAYCLWDDSLLKIYEVEVLDKQYLNHVNGEIVDVVKNGFVVKTGNGAILVKDICLSGKKRVKAYEYLNGLRDSVIGKVLK